MLNEEEEKKKLLMEQANCNCFMWQTVIIQAKEGKRERVRAGGRKSNRGTWPPHTAIRAVLGCDGRWQLALPWADMVPFFGPQGATSAAQTLSLQLPWPPESPPSRLGCHCLLPLLPHGTRTKTCCITHSFMITYSYRLMCRALNSSHSKGVGLHFVSVQPLCWKVFPNNAGLLSPDREGETA